jgi:hypothetical protein
MLAGFPAAFCARVVAGMVAISVPSEGALSYLREAALQGQDGRPAPVSWLVMETRSHPVAYETVVISDYRPRPASSEAQSESRSVSLRAGLIEEVLLAPDLPKVTLGTVVWRFDRSTANEPVVTAAVQAGSVTGEIFIRRAELSRHPRFVITISLRGIAGAIPVDAPRVRRTGAREGEPLIGRFVTAPEGPIVFESSSDPIDHENNLRRLTGPPWLDIILRSRRPELILTIEKGGAADKMLRELLLP